MSLGKPECIPSNLSQKESADLQPSTHTHKSSGKRFDICCESSHCLSIISRSGTQGGRCFQRLAQFSESVRGGLIHFGP